MVVAANRVALDPLGGGRQEWITAVCLSLDPLGRGLREGVTAEKLLLALVA